MFYWRIFSKARVFGAVLVTVMAAGLLNSFAMVKCPDEY